MPTYKVIGRAVKDHQVRLNTECGESILTRRFIPVSPGAVLTDTLGSLYVELHDGSNIQVSPAWKQNISFPVGDTKISLTIKEIESAAEFDGFLRLTKYHYRGARGAGRTVPLVATASSDELPHVLGFIEIATSFLVNSARKRVLDASFSDSDRHVSWIRWHGQTARRWINSIARISRCVVFPEFRGLGLSSFLVEAAVQYASERWYVAGQRPLFLEITADMLRYWPFVQKAGFLYVGDTEGNGHRAAQDMRYLIQKAALTSTNGVDGMPKGGGGILSLQRARATYLKQVVDETGFSLEDVINHLRLSPDKLSDEEWILLHTAYRRPKPTYMRGLTESSQRFLVQRVAATQLHSKQPSNSHPPSQQLADDCLLSIRNLTILAHSKPVSSSRSRRVQEAFGIVAERIDMPIVEELDLAVQSGEIILVTGPSGSGKSLLLQSLFQMTDNQGFVMPVDIRVKASIEGRVPTLGTPIQCLPDLAPIDALNHLPIEEALNLMAIAGLAEPQVLIRPARTLSLGQKYRLSLALGIAANVDILLVDEFCEPLDHFSAAAVARHLRRHVDVTMRSAVVATSRPHSIISALQPNRTLILSSDGQHAWRLTPGDVS